MRRRNFLDIFLEAAPASRHEPWFRANASAFIDVLAAHGKTAQQHHDMLVSRFIEKPSTALDAAKLSQVTASGPPLPVLLRSLAILRDLRTAAERDDVKTRHDDIARIKSMLA